jgi:hypothetical protein
MNTPIKIIIPVHSFVDLITNSSSEIFSSATDGTVTAAKDLINKVLAAGKSEKTCSDLFKVKLLYHARCYVDGEMTDREFESKSDFDCFKSSYDEEGNHTDYDVFWNDLVIEAKDSNNADAKAAAKVLNGFIETHEIWEQST